MFSPDDTIVAISTPLGRGAIGIVRLSGPAAAATAARLIARDEPLAPRYATLATLSIDSAAEPRLRTPESDPASFAASAAEAALRDHVVVTLFPQPHSYTGEDVVEISAHGSPVVLQGILRSAVMLGARLAEPGEFTLRAFLNGKLDLIQAEAVGDLIAAVTPLQARAAFDQLEGTLTVAMREIDAALFDVIARLEASLDFPDEGYHFVEREAAATRIGEQRARIDRLLNGSARGRLLREGAQVAIVGTPNVGKSSIFNTLLNAHRAIVTPIPGTTRDLVTERAEIGGLAVTLVDTAGLHESADVVEQEGMVRARQAVDVADLTLLVFDRSRPLGPDDRALLESTTDRRRLIVANKSDLPAAWSQAEMGSDAIALSALSGDGFTTLVEQMILALGAGDDIRDHALVSNVRHTALLQVAGEAIDRALVALTAGEGAVSEEFVLADLQEAASALQEITGQRTREDLLTHIFARFCIGK